MARAYIRAGAMALAGVALAAAAAGAQTPDAAPTSLVPIEAPAAAAPANPTPVEAPATVPPPAPVAAVASAPLTDRAVDVFYVTRQGAPVWFRDGDSRAAASKLPAILKRAPLDGLDDGPA